MEQLNKRMELELYKLSLNHFTNGSIAENQEQIQIGRTSLSKYDIKFLNSLRIIKYWREVFHSIKPHFKGKKHFPMQTKCRFSRIG